MTSHEINAPTRFRTENLMIKSHLLYQLSYRCWPIFPNLFRSSETKEQRNGNGFFYSYVNPLSCAINPEKASRLNLQPIIYGGFHAAEYSPLSLWTANPRNSPLARKVTEHQHPGGNGTAIDVSGFARLLGALLNRARHEVWA